ncbi:MAG: DUF6273 domain-containing protein [Oscillospiraceae bacterium]|jgi:tetratricopeptide (TPR) repeat protein|nr:DUF6273 domain-containing protein [Oscillospiraceae bacterium]
MKRMGNHVVIALLLAALWLTPLAPRAYAVDLDIRERAYQAAISYAEEGRLGDAYRIFAEQLGDYKDSKMYSLYLDGLINIELGYFAAAEYSLRVASLSNFLDARLYLEYAQGRICEENGDIDGAFTHYQSIVSADINGVMDALQRAWTLQDSMPETNIKAGDIYRFGNYDWLVLDARQDKALLITKDVIELRSYNTAFTSVTWETCTLRKYLNNDFYDNFNTEEKARIIETTIENLDSPRYATDGGNDTKDKVFLLSIQECVQYFGDSGQLANISPNKALLSDEYNNDRVAMYKGQATDWLLRSPGNSSRESAFVNTYGNVHIIGRVVSNKQSGVRPAMWIKL